MYPKRMLIYRSGVSEGSIERLRKIEIESIREACMELTDFGTSPPITFVVSLKQHNTRIVPKRPSGRDKNVPSGTCIDHTIVDNSVGNSNTTMIPQGCIRFSTDETLFDIVLTAQGGLKGTSKPFVHRVILNENAEYGPCDGTTPLTKTLFQEATYHMSYQYSTATKVSWRFSVRGIIYLSSLILHFFIFIYSVLRR